MWILNIFYWLFDAFCHLDNADKTNFVGCISNLRPHINDGNLLNGAILSIATDQLPGYVYAL